MCNLHMALVFGTVWHLYLAPYGIGIWHCTALVFGTVRYWYMALYGIGIWHCTALVFGTVRHWYLALYGTGIWHCTALVFGTVRHWYLSLYGIGICHCTALVFGTGIWHWYLPVITYIKRIVLLLSIGFVYNLFNLISISQAEWSTILTYPSFICSFETREMLYGQTLP